MADAISFHDLHRRDHVLVLPNAWDAATAVAFEKLGAEAIATTSAGFAWANGYSDGGYMPRRVVLDGVAAIARVTKLPLTVDLEGGYSDDPAEVAGFVHALLGTARVSGINIEDSDLPPDLLERKIRAVRRAADNSGVPLFINARVDVYLKQLVDVTHALEATLDRAARYAAAGCDGIFVPGVSDAAEIAKIVDATALPINVLAWPGLPPLDELRTIGVRRLSAGSSIASRAYQYALVLAADFLKVGSAGLLFKADSTPELNAWMRSIPIRSELK